MGCRIGWQLMTNLQTAAEESCSFSESFDNKRSQHTDKINPPIINNKATKRVLGDHQLCCLGKDGEGGSISYGAWRSGRINICFCVYLSLIKDPCSSSRSVVGVTQDLKPGVLELFDVCCRLTWITPADDGVAAAGTAGGLVTSYHQTHKWIANQLGTFWGILDQS